MGRLSTTECTYLPTYWAYPASKGMTDVCAHGDEAETAEAKRIIEMERLM